MNKEPNRISYDDFSSFISTSATFYELGMELSPVEIIAELKGKNKIDYDRNDVIVNDPDLIKAYNKWIN